MNLRTSRISILAWISTTLAVLGCAGGRPAVDGLSESVGGSNNGGAGGMTSETYSAMPGNGGMLISNVPVGSGGTNANVGGTTTVIATSTKPAVCGDGAQDPGENCDDRNTDDGDGCSADCKTVEQGFVCPIPGEPCKPSQVCGDKKISGTENCDDGNTDSDDGCSDKCKTEKGWTCPNAGARCKADQCGDGILVGAETCDDGNSKAGDGCSDTCQVESPGTTDRNGWMCPEVGAPCVRTTCGNGTKEGTEQCDDGNNDSGDGCTPACRQEPACPVDGGACKSVCGDGMKLPDDTDQECDDGNSADGDGCSADCKVEQGYACKDKPVKPTGQLILPVVYRDFKGGTTTGTGTRATTTWDVTKGEHPDFEHPYTGGGAESGIVKSKLGTNGKPVHSDKDLLTTTNNDTTSTPDWFSLWYRDALKDLPTAGSPQYNYTFVRNLTLTETPANSGVFSYGNTSFFPLDTETPSWGTTTGQTHNFHFTSEVRYWFQYAGNETLKFVGDDDVWVFVNKQLTLDLGGIHNAWTGTVQLDASNGTAKITCTAPTGETGALDCLQSPTVSLGLQIGKVYEIVVFQAERHTTKSNYTLTVSAFTATRSACESICGDGILTPDEACDLGKDDDGNSLNTGKYGTCNPDCTLPPTCGDAKIDMISSDPDVYEECDDGVNLASYGYNGKAACGPECKLTHFCGDGKVDSLFGEECDDGNKTSGDNCEPNCTHRVGCGNGILEPGEECDDGNTKSGDKCSEFCTEEKEPIILV